MALADLLSLQAPLEPVIRRPFVIAEAGVNHEGSLDIARRLIDEATEGGADAIKFQTYKADALASRDSPAYWDVSKEPTTSQHELFSRHDSFWKNEFEQLSAYCAEVGIEFISTPFDTAAAGFLNDLQGVFKIASADLTNHPFIEYLCDFGKPILLSTGASHLWEITETVELIRSRGNALGLLHCVLNYPTARTDANLGMILDLRNHFPDVVPGYSDHTLPDAEMSILTTAVLLGARVIEKHFTHDKTLPGNDHYHAMDRADLRAFRARIDELLSIVGAERKAALTTEEQSRRYARRSLVAARDIPPGRTLSAPDLTWKRPGTGISPRDYREVLGRVARVPIAADAILQWSMLD